MCVKENHFAIILEKRKEREKRKEERKEEREEDKRKVCV